MEGWSDTWLDEVTPPRRARRRRWAPHPGSATTQWATSTRDYLRSTPGRLLAITLTLCLVIAAMGYAMATAAHNREEQLSALLRSTEPTANAALNLSTSLSVLDNVATAQLVGSNTLKPQAFHQALDDSAVAAADAAASLTDEYSLQLINSIQRQLPVYAGIVETARANNRQGFPVAVAYFSEASALMRERILPAARELFVHNAGTVEARQHKLLRPHWVGLVLGGAALAGLVAAQWWLWVRTRRRINRGFLLATLLVAVAVGWAGGVDVLASRIADHSVAQVGTPWTSLTAARLQAQESHTKETLATVRRSSLSDANAHFQATLEDVQEAVETYQRNHPEHSVARAEEALRRWDENHTVLVARLAEGDFDAATKQIDTNAFADLDAALGELIASSRAGIRDYIAQALALSRWLDRGVVALAIAAVIALVLGMRPRFREYL